MNAVLLSMTGMAHASDDPRWVTYRQASERGWQVRAGERGTPVVFFKRLDVHERPGDPRGEATVRRVPLLRGFGIAPVRWTPMTLLREVFAYAQDPSPVFT